jgi:hypothetical protein
MLRPYGTERGLFGGDSVKNFSYGKIFNGIASIKVLLSPVGT